MFWRDRGRGGEDIVRFTGVLESTSGHEVKRFLDVDGTAPVVLDFSQASEIDYYGLSVLVAEIAQSGRAVILRGFHANHVRMLRYFGVDLARFGLYDRPLEVS